MLTPPRTVVRRESGLYALERALQRRGFQHGAGADEAGRGACAGPLVAAAAVLPEGRRGEIDELADSKLLTPIARERVYQAVVNQALAYAVVPVLEQKAREAGEEPPPSPFRDSLRVDGWKWLLIEVAVMIVLGFLSMGLDRWRRYLNEKHPPL